MEIVALGALAGLGYLYSQTQDLNQVDDLAPVQTYYKKNFENDEQLLHNIAGPPVHDPSSEGPLNAIQDVFYNARGYMDANPYGPEDVTNNFNTDGLYPLIGKGSNNPLTIEPQEPQHYRPHKQVVLQEDLHDTPRMQNNVYGNPSILEMNKAFVVDPYTKLNSSKGQMNHYLPGQESKDFGFANGEKMTLRTGGFHWGKRRIFREPPNQRKQMYFRIGNASKAQTRFNSLYQPNRGELGHLETPYNSQVKEWHRNPEPNAGVVRNKGRGNEEVVLQCTTRPYQLIPYAGPMGMVQGQREPLRLTAQQRDVIPNKTTDTPLWGFGKAATEMKGGQTMNPIQLRPTHKSCYVTIDNHLSNPAPFFPEGDSAALNFEYIRGAASEWGDTPLKALTDGPDVMRPALPVLNRNGAADALSGSWNRGEESVNVDMDGFLSNNERVNPVNLRHTQKSENIHHSAIRPMMANYSTAPQFDQEFPESENRKVTPLIENEIDTSLVDAYRQNPYTQPLPLFY
jgi:hypothetical protein